MPLFLEQNVIMDIIIIIIKKTFNIKIICESECCNLRDTDSELDVSDIIQLTFRHFIS